MNHLGQLVDEHSDCIMARRCWRKRRNKVRGDALPEFLRNFHGNHGTVRLCIAGLVRLALMALLDEGSYICRDFGPSKSACDQFQRFGATAMAHVNRIVSFADNMLRQGGRIKIRGRTCFFFNQYPFLKKLSRRRLQPGVKFESVL